MQKAPSTEPEIESQKDAPSMMSIIPDPFAEQSDLTANLHPALLDPEMSNYFFGSQTHNPPPASKFNIDRDPYTHTALLDSHDSSWLSYYETNFETYIAQPLSSSTPLDPVIDPAILSNLQSPRRISPLPNVAIEERSISIAPSMLSKSGNSPMHEETVWYSKGVAQVGGKPPHTNNSGEGKGKGRNLGQRPASDGGEGKGKGKVLGKRPLLEVEIPDSPPQRILGTRYEMNVETGLDTIKRIKLVFHDDPLQMSRPTSAGIGKSAADPIDLDTSQNSSPYASPAHRNGKKRDVLVRQDLRRERLRVTPPAAIDVDIGPVLPVASALHLDDNTPPPIPFHHSEPTRWIAVEVLIPFKNLDKTQYPEFLAKDAKQVLVRNKVTGQIKGISFAW